MAIKVDSIELALKAQEKLSFFGYMPSTQVVLYNHLQRFLMQR